MARTTALEGHRTALTQFAGITTLPPSHVLQGISCADLV